MPENVNPPVEESHTEAECSDDEAALVETTASTPSRRKKKLPELDDAQLTARVEAVLMTADRPMKAARLADVVEVDLEQGGSARIDATVDALNEVYDETNRAFRIERLAGGYRVMTRPEFSETIAALGRSRATTKLSQAGLETLAIVAYRQPITRADVEAIRGVACGEVLRSLLERHLVRVVGRAEEIGRPMLYGTTRHFLEVFGLASLTDLPDRKDLQGA